MKVSFSAACIALTLVISGCSDSEVKDEPNASLMVKNSVTGVTFESNAFDRNMEEIDISGGDENMASLVESLGGYEKFIEFLAESSPEDVTALHESYGVEVTVGGNVPPSESDGTSISPRTSWFECPLSLDPNESFWRGGNYMRADGLGRPALSTKPFNTTPSTGILSEYCQQKIGGAHGNGSDDGGHLVARQLGGYGYAGNIVPQNFLLNRGPWRKMENAVARCANANRYNSFYSVIPTYSGVGFRPTGFLFHYYVYKGGERYTIVGQVPNYYPNHYVIDTLDRAAIEIDSACS